MSALPITVVSGLPRSGTSLLMQMLAAGGIPPLTDGFRAPDEDNPHGYFEFRPALRLKSDTTWLPQAAGRVVKLVHLLLPELPSGHTCRVLWLRRHLPEVLTSQRRMLDRQGKAGAGLPDAQLARVFKQQLAQTEAWMKRQQQLQFLTLWHHEIMEAPTTQAARINTFLEAQLDLAAMSAVVDPTLHRQRQGNQGMANA